MSRAGLGRHSSGFGFEEAMVSRGLYRMPLVLYEAPWCKGEAQQIQIEGAL